MEVGPSMTPMAVAIVILAAGWLWLIVLGFKESVWWGLGNLLLWPALLAFAVLHWRKSCWALLTMVLGFATVAASAYLGSVRPTP
jgi:hypothetical protein